MLAAESAIRQRLAGIPGLAGVHGMADFAANGAAGKKLPAAFVLADGYRVDDGSSPGAVRLAVRWLVVLAVRNVADVVGGSGARVELTDLAASIMASLYRFQPPGFQPMRAVDAPRPSYEDGLMLYPLAFETLQIINRKE
ncbi:MAG: hypothetical protein JJ713_05670 [Acidithiobacillus sp.]|uniref:phage tail terminator protein n=1 Tax=Acidithiobacillus sp. TaxID=1872118 RepID=UPI00258D8F91|nr:hypothetical protein [Acidithiobacillus sp.]MCE5420257.1 hypothetical protein [Acidithiobacillus sp.]